MIINGFIYLVERASGGRIKADKSLKEEYNPSGTMLSPWTIALYDKIRGKKTEPEPTLVRSWNFVTFQHQSNRLPLLHFYLFNMAIALIQAELKGTNGYNPDEMVVDVEGKQE